MKRLATMIMGLIALVAVTGTASAALRAVQIPVLGGSLQGFLNVQDGGINVLTDQEDAQRWLTTVSNNSTFTIQIELSAAAGTNSIGMYNAGDPAPPLYQVFPGGAGAGWFAIASFRTAPVRVTVNLFDAAVTPQGTSTYLGADKNNFGFYLQQNGSLVLYSQDARNAGGTAQVLSYKGTGINSGSWWECFEDKTIAQGSDRDFDDCVLFCESINPTAVVGTSWGELKKRFR
jgi:hypothetical protein